ncbi:MAG: hypothetical protein WC121_09730 [Candidatus Kapaibacterium sp.]
MIIRLMNNHNANTPFSSKWVDVAPDMKGRNEKVVSLQISWSGIAGPMTGHLMLVGSNDQSNAGYKKMYRINSPNNFDDSELIVIRQVFKFFKIEYIPVGIIEGQISAHLYYK